MNRYLHLFLIIIAISCTPPCLMATSPDTLTLQPGPSTGKDAEIRDDRPDTPNGTSEDFIANAWTAGYFFIQRSLIRFDLSQIPPQSTVSNAILKLSTNLNTPHYQMDSGQNSSFLYRVIDDWNESDVTWNTQPGISMNNPVILPKSTSNTQTYYLDVTDHIQDMVNHPDSNFGWLFRLQTEQKFRCLVFASSDNQVVEWRPLLTVIYSPCDLPVASFTSSVNNLNVSFQETSLSSTSWFWDFGDGYSSTLQNPSHDYSLEGVYHVCLRVADSCGADTICQDISVCNGYVKPFTYSSDSNSVHFSDSSYLANSWYWSFGDGNFSGQHNPVHHYEKSGIYYVCEQVSFSCGDRIICDSIKYFAAAVWDQKEIWKPLIWPNPAFDHINIYTGSNRDFTGEIIITNGLGQRVKSFSQSNDNVNEIIRIDLSGILPGMYFITIKKADTRYFAKLIVQ